MLQLARLSRAVENRGGGMMGRVDVRTGDGRGATQLNGVGAGAIRDARILAAMTVLGVVSGRGTLGAKRRTGGGLAVSLVPPPVAQAAQAETAHRPAPAKRRDGSAQALQQNSSRDLRHAATDTACPSQAARTCCLQRRSM